MKNILDRVIQEYPISRDALLISSAKGFNFPVTSSIMLCLYRCLFLRAQPYRRPQDRLAL